MIFWFVSEPVGTHASVEHAWTGACKCGERLDLGSRLCKCGARLDLGSRAALGPGVVRESRPIRFLFPGFLHGTDFAFRFAFVFVFVFHFFWIKGSRLFFLAKEICVH